LKPGNRKILAYLREYGEDTILCVANLSRSAQPVELNLTPYKGRILVEMLGRTTFPPVGDLPYLLTLSAYGFYWFRLTANAEAPSWHEQIFSVDERPVLVLFDGWSSLFRDRVVPWRIGMAEKTRLQFETDTLPRFIESQRWYAAKGTTIERARITDHVVWTEAKISWVIALLDVGSAEEPAAYFMPLALAWEERDEERVRNLSTSAIAKIRQQANVGIMGDAFADEAFCRALLAAMQKQRDIPTAQGRLQFRPTAAFAQLAGKDFAKLPAARPQGSSSNTVVVMGERLILKGYRRLRAGASPELEMGLYLTDEVKYPHCAAVAGSLDYVGNDGETRLLAMVQAYVANQGDGWTYALEYLRRHLEVHRTAPASDALPVNSHEAFLIMIRTLARRTAELHGALATRTGNPGFEPMPLGRADVDGYRQRALGEAQAAFGLLKANLEPLAPGDRDKAGDVLGLQQQLVARLEACAAEDFRGQKIRIHGDYHLGQVLVTRNDFVIVDFEGEPGHTIEQRRARQSPLRDVAGMLRSFSYVEHSALRSVAHDEVEYGKLARLARGWNKEVRAAFLEAYDAEAKRHELYATLVPGRGLLGLFELEKALYELRYELSNRPAWAGIPLQGILEWSGT
jgi:maltose alpha-D-glucosyltransferase/alpha-amylase